MKPKENKTLNYSKDSVAEFIEKSFKEVRNWEQDAETFKKMVEHMPVSVYVYRWTKVIYVNPFYEKLTGFSLEEMKQKDYWDVIHPDQH
jgi:PAS domain-containing protein